MNFLEKSGYAEIRERIAEGMNANKTSLRNGRTPLIAVTLNRNLTSGEKIDLIGLLLKKGAYIDLIDHFGDTPLLYAVAMRDLSVVNYMVEQSADIDAVNMKGATPFSLALGRQYFEIADLLLAKGAYIDPKTTRGATPLYSAAREGNLQKVNYLLSRGAQVNVNGLTPLMAAASAGKLEMTRFLVEKHGADINARTREGYTALAVAAQAGHENVMIYLIAKGAMLNPCARTPLMAAAAAGQTKAAILLLDKGADINQAGKKNASAVLQAVQATYYDLARLLIQRGANYPVFDEQQNYYVSASVNRLFADHHVTKKNYRKAQNHFEKASRQYNRAADIYVEIATLYGRQARKEKLKRATLAALAFWAETEQARLQTRQHRHMTSFSGVKSSYVVSPTYAQTAAVIGTRKNTLLMTPGGWQNEMDAYVNRGTIPLVEREKFFTLHAKEARTLAKESHLLGQCHSNGVPGTIINQCIAARLKTAE